MTTAIQKTEQAMEFVPFGAVDKIKLTLNIVKQYIAKPTRSGATCTDRDAVGFMMLCQAQRLNPFAGDAFLTGYDAKNGPVFSLIVSHVAYMKRAESNPEFEGMESGVIIQTEEGLLQDREGDFAMPDEKVVGGWARVFRKGRKPTFRRLHINQRKPAYETPFWEGNKAFEQIVKCAEVDALRNTFPTLLGGLPLQGEAIEVETVVTAENPKQAAEAPATIPAKAETPQSEMAAFLAQNGFTFADLIKWGAAEGHIPDADSIGSIDDLPSDVCKRLLRAKTGLLASLKAGKAVV